MNEVFYNPIYQRDLKAATEAMNVLLYMDPLMAYKIIRDNVSHIIGSKEFKEKMTCGTVANCSFCCHDRIDMGKVESEYIKSVIKAKNIIPNKDRIQKQNANTTIKWMDKACPLLLDEDDKGQRLCSIYEDRPLVCMIHNSASDPEQCNKENDPNKVTNQGRSGGLDAFYFTSVRLGRKDENIVKPFITMHEMLLDVI